MKLSKWLALPLTVLVILAVALVGCTTPTPTTTPTTPATNTNTPNTTPTTPAGTGQPSPTNATPLSGTITEAGSTTVQPLAELIGASFMSKTPGVTVVIQGGGSGVGFASAVNGTVDIGALSRELTAEESAQVVEHVIARDGIAIVAAPGQTVSNLTIDQIRDIFSGEITNWSEVGGADKAIHVVSREEGSGTRAAFEELVMGKEAKIAASAILQSSNGAIRTTVSGDPDAIAYLSFGYVDSSIKSLSVNGVAGTLDNVNNGTYPIVRPLLFVTKAQPTGLVKAFLDYCLSAEGQAIVAKDYIPVK